MKKLLIDCSFIITTELNTGIQRVVRKVVENMGYICDDYQMYQVVLEDGKINEVSLFNEDIVFETDITPQQGDILLLLDSTWHLDNWSSVKLAKDNGAKVIATIYDIIPISHPQFCDDNLVKIFKSWFDIAINYVDGFIAISNTVEMQLKNYLQNSFPDKIANKQFDYFLLGADFDYKEVSIYTKEIKKELIKLYDNNKNIYLIVCTVEPRKNHKYLLDVFDQLWNNDIDVTLNIVGKIGWKVEELMDRIHNHKEYNQRLFHWDNLNDMELNYCYENSKMLLFSSYIEGFGLPIVESLNNRLPVLASDISIHREVGGDKIGYFDIDNCDDLVKKITDIEINSIPKNIIPHKDFKWMNWGEATEMLFNKIEIVNKKLIDNDIHNMIENFDFDNKKNIIENIAQNIIDNRLDELINDDIYIQIATKIKQEKS